MKQASLGAVLKIIAHSSFTVWRLCCLGLPFFFVMRRSLCKTKKSKSTISIYFWVPSCLPCPSFTLLKLFLWWKQHMILAQRVGGSISLCGCCWFTLLNHLPVVLLLCLWERCCEHGCLHFSLPPVCISGAGTPWVTRAARGPGKCCSSQQRGSRRAVASSTTSILPPARLWNSWEVTKHIQESQTVRSQASHPVLPLCCLRSIIINYQFFRNAINLTAV